MRFGSLLSSTYPWRSLHTGVFDIQATVKKGNARGLMFRDVKYNMNIFGQGSRFMMLQNLQTKTAYTIDQDRIYGSHFPRNFVIGVNPLKKEFKLSVERPAYEDPLMIMMHSQTNVATYSQSLNNKQDISSSCPECKTNTQVSYESSSTMNATPPDPTSMENTLIARWNPAVESVVSFNPDTFGNGIRMGIRQIRAYF
ncbi:Putative LOC100868636, partial [Caligus rogercresseyi]